MPIPGMASNCDAVFGSFSAIASSTRSDIIRNAGMPRFAALANADGSSVTSEALAAHWGDLLRFCIDTFGPDRAMFESNFPVDGETAGYGVLWNTFKKVSSGYTAGERALLFAGTARRVYRL